jgi:hypothetical protein
MEVWLPETLTGLQIDPRRILDAWRRWPADEVELGEDDFQNQSSWTKDAESGATQEPTKTSGPPSNSPHQPRAGGGRQRERARRSGRHANRRARTTAARRGMPPPVEKRENPSRLPSPPRPAREEKGPTTLQHRQRRHEKRGGQTTQRGLPVNIPRPPRREGQETERNTSAGQTPPSPATSNSSGRQIPSLSLPATTAGQRRKTGPRTCQSHKAGATKQLIRGRSGASRRRLLRPPEPEESEQDP